VASFSKLHCIDTVLLPSPDHFLPISLNKNCVARTTVLALVKEHFTNGGGFLTAGAGLSQLDWDLSIDVRDPVEALPFNGVNKVFVSLGGHKYNAIVCH